MGGNRRNTEEIVTTIKVLVEAIPDRDIFLYAPLIQQLSAETCLEWNIHIAADGALDGVFTERHTLMLGELPITTWRRGCQWERDTVEECQLDDGPPSSIELLLGILELEDPAPELPDLIHPEKQS